MTLWWCHKAINMKKILLPQILSGPLVDNLRVLQNLGPSKLSTCPPFLLALVMETKDFCYGK